MFNENFYFKLIENDIDPLEINNKYNIFNNLKNIMESDIIYKDSIISLLSEEKLKFMKEIYTENQNFLLDFINSNIYNNLLDEEMYYINEAIYNYKLFLENERVQAIEIENKPNNIIINESALSMSKDLTINVINKLSILKKSLTYNDNSDGSIIVSGKEKSKRVKAKIFIKNNKLIIKNIDFRQFFLRIQDMYKEKNFGNMFQKSYTWFSELQYNKKMIRKKDMKIESISIPLFFALEMYQLFKEMSAYYSLIYYSEIAELIRKNTWVKKLYEPIFEIPVNLNNLKNIKYTLKDYQLEFVKNYRTLKERFSFEGYLLSFDQGLGKTLTSIALSECLDKTQIVIVCPNSLRENWSYEIRSYFNKYENEKIWKEEVYVADHPKYKFNKNKCKYLIVNMESISKIYPYIRNEKNNMIIVDESHNFRNATGKRVAELINLKNKLECKDNLLMSGTPIKAVPNEIVPTLMMIDPMFDLETAKLYNKAFNVNDTETKNIVNARFGIIMHRKTKAEVLALPEKIKLNLMLTINNSDRFLNSEIHKECMDKFGEYYSALLEQNSDLRNRYIWFINRYSSATKEQNDYYLQYIGGMNEDYTVKSSQAKFHDLDLEFFNEFPNKYVLPNITDVTLRKEFELVKSKFIYMKNSAMGKALGEILPKRRTEMYIALYEENKNLFIDKIINNPRKTVIFSMMLDVVKYISDDLTKNGVKNVKIVGGTGNRMDLIQEFKNSDDINVLLATSQTLSTGVTLTEANQMFFFGTPWRDADYQQCQDRIYRIGQQSDVTIYNVLLQTEKGNLSTRMNDILEWSGNMFDSMIENQEKELQEAVNKAEDIELTSLSESFIDNKKHIINSYIIEEEF